MGHCVRECRATRISQEKIKKTLDKGGAVWYTSKALLRQGAARPGSGEAKTQ